MKSLSLVTSSEAKQLDSEASRLSRYKQVLNRELKMCRELQEVEPTCKWVLLTIAVLVHALHSVGEQQESYEQTILQIIEKLLQLDPMRSNYYLDVKRKLLAHS